MGTLQSDGMTLKSSIAANGVVLFVFMVVIAKEVSFVIDTADFWLSFRFMASFHVLKDV